MVVATSSILQKSFFFAYETSRVICQKTFHVIAAPFRYIAAFFQSLAEVLAKILNRSKSPNPLNQPSPSQSPEVPSNKIKPGMISSSLEFAAEKKSIAESAEKFFNLKCLDLAVNTSQIHKALQAPLQPTFGMIEKSLSEWFILESSPYKQTIANLIKEAFVTNASELSLSGSRLTSLPGCIRYLKLESLDLSRNEFKKVPAEVLAIKELKNLNLSSNQLKFYDAWNFRQLRHLNLCANPLERLCSPQEPYLPLEELLLSSTCKMLLMDVLQENSESSYTPTIYTSVVETLKKLPNLRILNLSANNLNKHLARFSHCLESLKHLEELDLSSSGLKSIPSEIAHLEKLKKIYLNDNKLKEVPSELCKCVNLEKLSLSENKLKEVSKEIEKLKKLQVIHLDNNKLRSLPSEIGQLINLVEMNLSDNDLLTLPTEIENLQNLESLNISENYIDMLPNGIECLSSLTFLDISWNLLQTLPTALGNLKKLVRLEINGNRLKSIPAEISDLTQLAFLDLGNNLSLKQLPDSLAQNTYLAAINIEGTSIAEEMLNSILNACRAKRKELFLSNQLVIEPSIKNLLERKELLMLTAEQKHLIYEWILLLTSSHIGLETFFDFTTDIEVIFKTLENSPEKIQPFCQAIQESLNDFYEVVKKNWQSVLV